MLDSLPYLDVSQRHYSTALGASKLRFEFSGTGFAYFKIWALNLVLTLLSLGLYYPWAKVRRLRYFYANTQFDGDSLAYDGDPLVLARGYGLLAVVAVMGCAVSYYSKWGGVAALMVLAVLAPWLLHASLRYRLGHTRWRGLRLGFSGTQKQAYQAILPLSGAVAAVLILALLIPWNKTPPAWLGYCAVALAVVYLGIAPWLVWNVKQYQHKHFTLGRLKSRFKATAQDYFQLFLHMYLFTAIVISIATSLAIDWLRTSTPFAAGLHIAAPSTIGTTAMLYFAAVFLTLWLLVRPFAKARLQDIAWTQTGNDSLRCVSALRYRSLVWLGLKNSLLMVATLGLYWPFAAVAAARLRIESIHVKTPVDPNILVSSAQPQAGKTPVNRPRQFWDWDIGL